MRVAIALLLGLGFGLVGCGLTAPVRAQGGYQIITEAQESHPGVFVWQIELETVPQVNFTRTFSLPNPVSVRNYQVSYRASGCDVALFRFDDQDGLPMVVLLLQGSQNGNFHVPAMSEGQKVVNAVRLGGGVSQACRVEFVLTGEE